MLDGQVPGKLCPGAAKSAGDADRRNEISEVINVAPAELPRRRMSRLPAGVG